MNVRRTLIVDDDASFRRCLREFLASEPDIEIVGEAVDGQDALDRVQVLEPDLILMDVRMPRLNGIEATLQLKSRLPHIRIIFLTSFRLSEYREAARAIGVDGYVVKRAMLDDLLPAIRAGQRDTRAPMKRPGQAETVQGKTGRYRG